MNMTHPDILKMERDGCIYAYDEEEYCAECGARITDEEYWEDLENVYCTRECADKYHGLKRVN